MSLAPDALMQIFGLSRLDQTHPTERAGQHKPSQAHALPAPVDLTEARRGASRLRVRCSCGAWIDWRAATFVGYQDDGVERLELRTHGACGSTRALVVASAEGRE